MGREGGKVWMIGTDLNGRHQSRGRGLVLSDSDGPKWPPLPSEKRDGGGG